MTQPGCIPAEYWDALPAELRPGLPAIVAAFEARIAPQDARIAELEARLNRNSSNSSRPPSSDPPHLKTAPPREPSGRRRGGRPGHRRNDRIRLEPDEVVDVRPDRCRRCGEALAGDDRDPLVRQVFELPVVRPHVVEYRLHRSACPRCGASTCGVAPVGAEVGYPANVDETSRPQGRRGGWLWAAVAEGLGVFKVAASRSRDAFEDLMGRSPPGVVTSDCYSAYSHLPSERRQACWAHLRRDFRAMVDRGDAGSAIGEDLLMNSGVLFDGWSKVRVGAASRRTFATKALPWLRREVRELLRRGASCGSPKTAATCREILKVEPSLWTFAKAERV